MAELRRSQRLGYKPGTVVPWDDASNWVCHCSSGVPVGDSFTVAGQECVECTTCKKSWGHGKCYGFEKIYANARLFAKWEWNCLECSGTDPSIPPPIIDPNPSPEPTTATIARATILRDEGNDDRQDDGYDNGFGNGYDDGNGNGGGNAGGNGADDGNDNGFGNGNDDGSLPFQDDPKYAYKCIADELTLTPTPTLFPQSHHHQTT